MTIAGWRSSGIRPAPSAGAGSSRANGFASAPANSISPQKKAPNPISTAVAHGTTSRSRFRVAYRTAEEASDRTHAHSSSEPPWLDHIAVIL
jgi:hypothetical protein